MDKTSIKKYFKTGCKPTEAQFAALFDSIIFKDESGDTIPASRVSGLENVIAILLAQYIGTDFDGEIKLGSEVTATWKDDDQTVLNLTIDGTTYELNLAQGSGGGSSVSGEWNDAETVFTLNIDGEVFELDFSTTGGGSTGSGVKVVQHDGYVTLVDSEGTTATVYDGAKGDTGENGKSVTVTDVEGGVALTDGNGTTAVVYDGEQGVKGDKGDTGDTGTSAHISQLWQDDDGNTVNGIDDATHVYIQTWEGDGDKTISPDLMSPVNEVLAAVESIIGTQSN